jgi:outer membrane protein
MVVSSRAIAAVGLGLVGLAVIVGPSLGQDRDAAIKKVNSQAAGPKAPVPPVFGSIDMGVVFKGYDKFKFTMQEFEAAVNAKQSEMVKVMHEYQQEQEMLSKMTPGSVDAKKHESRMTELKAKAEAEREQAQRDFALREAEIFATIYKEIQTMVARVAKYRGMTYVLRTSNDPISGADPQSSMVAIQRTVVYADPSNDITNDVVTYLNRQYKAAGGQPPKAGGTVNAPTAK